VNPEEVSVFLPDFRGGNGWWVVLYFLDQDFGGGLVRNRLRSPLDLVAQTRDLLRPISQFHCVLHTSGNDIGYIGETL
jgi:hypothetical protein